MSHAEGVPHPAMGDAASALPLLNNYTRTVLAAAARAEVPDGWTLMVAADSDLVLNHPARGHWIGLRLLGAGSAERTPVWRADRGSLLVHDDELRDFSTLAVAIETMVKRSEGLRVPLR
jgi:hypothetical protein